MSTCIRQIGSVDEARQFVGIYANAFTASGRSHQQLLEYMQDEIANDDRMSYWGAWQGATMVGGLAALDLRLNYAGQMIDAGGLGNLCVGLAHKRQGLGRQLVEFFLKRCRQRDQHLALLYPFRPDFYRRLGFGYGPKRHRYTILPSSLPQDRDAPAVVTLNSSHRQQLARCYADKARRQHGYCERGQYEIGSLLERFAGAGRLVGCLDGDRLLGYVAFDFTRAHPTNFLVNDLVVRELVWLEPRALLALAGFLGRQSDQVRRIRLATYDPDLHYLLTDARDDSGDLVENISHRTNTAGLGLMYRVVSVDRFLEATAPARTAGATTLNLHLTDGLCPGAVGRHRLQVEAGALRQADLHLDISDLSSLLMGAVGPETLHSFGRLRVDPAPTAELFEALRVERPDCATTF